MDQARFEKFERARAVGVYRHQLGALSRDVAGQYGNSGIAAGYHQTIADLFVLLKEAKPRPRWALLEEYGVGRRQPPDGWRSSQGYCTRAHLRELHRLTVINIRTFGQQIGLQNAFGPRDALPIGRCRFVNGGLEPGICTGAGKLGPTSYKPRVDCR